LAPASASALTGRARVPATQAGEEKGTAAKLVAGSFSGETSYSTTFAKNMRIDW